MAEANTLGKLLNRLAAEGVITHAYIDRIAKHLKSKQHELESPWYIRALVAIGAWLAAVCFIGFLSAAGLISNSTADYFGWGVFFITAATVMWNLVSQVSFLYQLSIALSVAGHSLMFIWAGTVEIGRLLPRGFATTTMVVALLWAALYPTFRDPLHRFLSSLLLTTTVTAWLLQSKPAHGLHLLVLVEIVGLIFFFTSRETSNKWQQPARPLAYALAVSLLLTSLIILVGQSEIVTPSWPSSLALTVGLCYLYVWTARGETAVRREPVLWAIATTLALAVVSTPGVLAALALLLIGYARDNRILLGLGVGFFPVFITLFYYYLNIDLLTKSLILMGSGIVVLIARQLAGYRPWARGES